MKNSGFTLVEILVSLAIFSVVMVTATGALLMTIDTNHKTQAIQSTMNNLSFALEGMSRIIRVGSVYHCGNIGTLADPRDCNSGDTFFAFRRSSDGATVSYFLSGNQIFRQENAGAVLAISAPEITVNNLKFYVRGAGLADTDQPRVTIVIQGQAGSTVKTQTTFNLQTTLSQRIPQ